MKDDSSPDMENPDVGGLGGPPDNPDMDKVEAFVEKINRYAVSLQ